MALDLASPALSDGLVILGAAGIVIPAFARLRITPVIGFILVGILVGPHGLGALVDRAPWLYWVTISDMDGIAPFAEFGIILLLFSIGLELSFKRLWSIRKRVIGFGASELIGSALIIAAGLMLLGITSGAAIGLGVALALSSPALVLPIAGTTGPVGRLAFAMLLFEDLALVPIIFVLGALGPASGGDAGSFARLVVTSALTIAAMLVAGWFLLPLLFSQAARTKSPELFLSASLLVVIVASIATTAVGLSPIVGALVAGLLISETDYAQEVEAITSPFKGLALGVFLISVGMSLDLGLIATNWSVFIGAVVGIVAIKAAVTSALLAFGGVRRGTAIETGVLMASPSETTLIVLGAAVSAKLIDAEAAAFWQVVTAIGLTITPLLARVGRDVARRLEWRSAPLPEDIDEARTILVGYGRVGRLVGDMLDAHKRPWIAIEAEVDAVTMARREGRRIVFGDAGRAGMLEAHGVEKALAVVLTMDDPAQVLRLTRRLSADYPDLTIVARARDTDDAGRLYRAGASNAVPETLESSLQLSEAVLVDLGVPMGPVIASIHAKRDELRERIKADGDLDHLPRLRTS